MVDSGEYMYVSDAFFDMNYKSPSSYMNIVHYEVRGGHFKVCEVDDYRTVIKKSVNKILVAGNPEYLEKNHEAMRAPFEDKITVPFQHPFILNTRIKELTKQKP